jgi:GNAT superfamily N-acetyltransferase
MTRLSRRLQNIRKRRASRDAAVSSIVEQTKDHLRNTWSSTTMKVLTAGPVIGPDRDVVLAFLGTEGYSRPIQPADEIFAAWAGAEVVAAVRLAAEGDVLVLRGMRVREDLRRRGVGRQLLSRLDGAIGQRTCWCIPYGWLTDFYASIGFEVADVGDAPAFLAERHTRYVQQGLNVVIMVRRPAGR